MTESRASVIKVTHTAPAAPKVKLCFNTLGFLAETGKSLLDDWVFCDFPLDIINFPYLSYWMHSY